MYLSGWWLASDVHAKEISLSESFWSIYGFVRCFSSRWALEQTKFVLDGNCLQWDFKNHKATAAATTIIATSTAAAESTSTTSTVEAVVTEGGGGITAVARDSTDCHICLWNQHFTTTEFLRGIHERLRNVCFGRAQLTFGRLCWLGRLKVDSKQSGVENAGSGFDGVRRN